MKFIGIILAILFLSFSFIPCADTAIGLDKHEYVVKSHDHQNCDSDLCSPFCQCHCCHSHVIVQDIPVFEITNTCFFTSDFEYIEKYTSAFTDRFIPPPQV